MRIAHICETWAHGGIEHLIVDLCAAMRKNQVESMVTFLYGANGVSAGKNRTEVDVLPVRMNQRMEIDPLGLLRLRQALVRFHPDVLHCHNPRAAFIALLLRGMGVRVPIVLTVHYDIYPSCHRLNAPIRWTARRCDRVVGDSPHTTATIQRYTFGTVRPLTIFIGIDMARVNSASPQARDASRQTLGINKDSLVLVTVARLTKQKDHPTLFRAFAQALPRLGDALLLVVGGGTEQGPLQDLVNHLGMERRIILFGTVPDINVYLAASDIFVLSTRNEGFGICVVEACCAGIPVVATGLGPLRDLRDAGLDLVLAKPGDIESLRDALISLSDPLRRQSLGRQLRERAMQLFSIEETSGSYFSLYREVAGDHGKSAAPVSCSD